MSRATSDTGYEDQWWKTPIQLHDAEDKGERYELLEGVHDSPITSYDEVGALEPFDNPRVKTDPRFRLILHFNWKAQTLPVIIGGFPSKSALSSSSKSVTDVMHQPQLQQCSPRAQIVKRNYKTPTVFTHGTDDGMIPWQMTQGTYETLSESGEQTGVELPESEGWRATRRGL
ncbi:uncharacterized protein K444DRAFT_653862 [Hyaloscypha bicolor E]|uniref:Peptidase S9 prolyl oligopeptidase catalytic domain-containing protein n=1 Tax=Hyaloscypha bicolor E TaxID=1095630 RepID=A0A2J6T3D4_9HELO|nr:uncharacterized protein K444DRAFT_653862 [Hyaloscypha bicolor E]PMD57540.1 hypothetical protein K444DRAFT_653862 [Hyaloscypha bicolor E]